MFRLKQYLKEQNGGDENKQPMPILAALNEMKPLKPVEREMIPLDKYQLEVEQRVILFSQLSSPSILHFVFFLVQKYFEDLFKQRDREFQQMKMNFESLKADRDKEVVLMENIILELQLQLFVH